MRDLSVGAECIATLLSHDRTAENDDVTEARAMTGAVMIAEGLAELRNIRKLLTSSE